MTEFIVIASGKGGVGKTTTAINLATAFVSFGRDVILIDANLKNPNIGLLLGAPKVPITLHDVLDGKKDIKEAIYIHRNGLKVIPASLSLEDMQKVKVDLLDTYISELAGHADIVIIDSSAGLGEDALAAMRSGDRIIIVTTPDLAAVTDALKTIKICEKHEKHIMGVIINKARQDDFEMEKKSIEYILEKPILAFIPEDDKVRQAHHLKTPVTFAHPYSSSAVGYKKLAADLLGEKYVESIEKEDSMLDYVLKTIGFKP